MTTQNAQFNIARILRPFAGFESVYQGKDATIPIQLTEKGIALDSEAGSPGYSPKLLKGLSVPMGSRLIIWLPHIFGGFQQTAIPYKWEINWRMRNTFDFRRQRIPYHYPKQGVGIPDPGPLVVIPGSMHCIIYNNTQPATINGGVVSDIRAEDITARPRRYSSTDTDLPLLPDGSRGYIQQGILPFDLNELEFTPTYSIFETMVMGDEFLIGVHRVATPQSWDLGPGGFDFPLSQMLGNGTGTSFPDVGIYAMVGSDS